MKIVKVSILGGLLFNLVAPQARAGQQMVLTARDAKTVVEKVSTVQVVAKSDPNRDWCTLMSPATTELTDDYFSDPSVNEGFEKGKSYSVIARNVPNNGHYGFYLLKNDAGSLRIVNQYNVKDLSTHNLPDVRCAMDPVMSSQLLNKETKSLLGNSLPECVSCGDSTGSRLK